MSKGHTHEQTANGPEHSHEVTPVQKVKRNPKIEGDTKPVAPTKEEKQAAKDAARAAKQAERDEANALKEQERAAKNAEKQAARDAANAEKQAARDAANAEKQAERDAANALKEKEREAKKAELQAEREKAKEAGRAQREADKLAKAAEREQDKINKKQAREELKLAKAAEREEGREAAKAARSEEAARRAQMVEDRKNATKTDGARRSKATHIIYTGEGFSTPQTTSIRGQVLKHIQDNYSIGDEISIEKLAKDCKPLLFGTNVRSYLSKLEERGHLDFVAVAVAPEAEETVEGKASEEVAQA